MDNDNPKPTPGQQVKETLAAAISRKASPGQQVKEALTAAMSLPRPCPRPTPEFGAYLDTLDVMGFHIALYPLRDLKVPSSSIPTLLPMIDQRWFVDRLEAEVSFTLKQLEDLEKGNSRALPTRDNLQIGAKGWCSAAILIFRNSRPLRSTTCWWSTT